jgi:DNA-binding NtrC family response regulator
MTKKKILIVEDEIIIARELEIILRNLRYEVCATVVSGEAALQATEKYRPDLILMDIMLIGDMDGIETSSRITSANDLPVVYITAYDDQQMLDRAKLTEPYGFILKPFETRTLYVVIEIALYKHQAEKERKELLQQLKDALAKVKIMSGLLPICASCKKIRDDKGYWNQIEKYIQERSDVDFSHSICPECAKKLYPDFYTDRNLE